MDPNKLLLAQTEHPMPTLSGIGPNPTDTNTATSQLENTLSMVIGVLTIISVIFFTIQLILAGYSFMSAGGDPKKLEAARKKLTDGILGLTIVVVAYGLGALLANLTGIGQGTSVFNLDQMFTKIGR